jgi:hypothetical protein
MNKRIISGIIGVFVLAAPVAASAQDWEAIKQDQIAALQKQIATLQAKLNALLNNAPEPHITWVISPASGQQQIAIDVTTATGTKRFDLGSSRDCTASTDVSYNGWRSVLGTVICYSAGSSTMFTAYYELNHFYVERVDFNTDDMQKTHRDFPVNVLASSI